MSGIRYKILKRTIGIPYVKGEIFGKEHFKMYFTDAGIKRLLEEECLEKIGEEKTESEKLIDNINQYIRHLEHEIKINKIAHKNGCYSEIGILSRKLEIEKARLLLVKYNEYPI